MKGNKTIFQKLVIIFIGLIVVLIFDFWLFIPKNNPPESSNKNIDASFNGNNQLNNQANNISLDLENFSKALKKSKTEGTIPDQEIVKIKSKINLPVPFQPQAPFANWDKLHNEACEEASLIIAKHWLDKQELTAQEMNDEILKMVSFEEKKWGGHYDLDVEHTIELADSYYNIKLDSIINPSEEDIKKQLSQGNLIIAPMAGRLLQNPYYRNPGPVYHMLIVRGYNKKEVITNDPGTKRGEGLKYSWNNFLSSIHEWPLKLGSKISKERAAQEILKGASIVIVVKK